MFTIDVGLSANSWIMTYDALRQGLIVASDNNVRMYTIKYPSCFGV